jgi:proteasome lid subunit RPN8/RPN11
VILRLRTNEMALVHAHLSLAYPEEGCGVMLGVEREEAREVRRVIGFENRREDSRHNRYLIAPEQFLAADKEARAAGLDVLGFFHSHPEHPAQPSDFDREHAWPYYSYMIVSIERGQAVDTRSWRLTDDRLRFEPETLELLPDDSSAAPRPEALPGGRGDLR